MTTVACLLCASCAYIRGGPDFAQVETDARPSTVDRTPVTGAPTGSTGLSPEDVGVGALEIDMTADHVSLQVQLIGEDAALEGSTLVWTDGVTTSEPVAIPEELDSWDPSERIGVLFVDDRPADCTSPTFERAYAVQVTDASGGASAWGDAQPFVVQIVDAGTPTGNRQPLGSITAPALVCGRLDSGDDQARLGSEHHPGGTWNVTLTFDGSASGVQLKVKPENSRDVELIDKVSPQTEGGLVIEDGRTLEFDVDRYGSEGEALTYQILLHP